MVGESLVALEAQDELHVVEVVALLLRVCRDTYADLDVALQHATLEGGEREPYLDAAVAAMGLAMPADDPEYLGADELRGLATLLRAAHDDVDLARRARDAATAIDDYRGDHTFAWFASRTLACRADAPLPIAPLDAVTDEMGTPRGLVPAPDQLTAPPPATVPLDGTCTIRLCPRDLGPLSLVIDGRFHAALDELFVGHTGRGPGPTTRWAAVTPTIDWHAAFTFDRVEGGFGNVRLRPDAAAAYRERVMRLLDAARDAGAAIVALPELSLDEALEDSIEAWFSQHPGVAIVLAGSRHLVDSERDGERYPVNRARLFVRGVPPGTRVHHDKFAGFEFDGLVELIRRPNQVTIFSGRRWSFTPLICRDFLGPDARTLLTKTRVRAVLVAALSPKSELFCRDALATASDGQCLVFISNTPLEPAGHTAIFARPVRAAWAAAENRADDEPGGRMAMIETSAGSFQPVTIS